MTTTEGSLKEFIELARKRLKECGVETFPEQECATCPASGSYNSGEFSDCVYAAALEVAGENRVEIETLGNFEINTDDVQLTEVAKRLGVGGIFEEINKRRESKPKPAPSSPAK